jgi:ferrous iron transport protein B
VAAIAAIYRETTPGWTLFAALWTTGLGYALATIFYQGAIFARDPLSSAAWIGIMVGSFALVLIIMRRWAAREPAPDALVRQGA